MRKRRQGHDCHSAHGPTEATITKYAVMWRNLSLAQQSRVLPVAERIYALSGPSCGQDRLEQVRDNNFGFGDGGLDGASLDYLDEYFDFCWQRTPVVSPVSQPDLPY